MLRATFTKIKRACVITLVPRIVRGEGRYTTRKFGKTSVNVLRKAGKSTDSGSKDGENETDKCRRLIDFVFGPSKPKAEAHEAFKGENKTTIGNIQEIHKDNVVQTQTKTDINTKKQNNLLKDFVGVDEDVLRQDYDYYYKNLKLQAAAMNKNKVTRNKDNIDDDTLNTRRNINISQSEIDKGYDDYESKWSSETSKNLDKESSTNDYVHKRYNLHDIDLHKNIPEICYKKQTTVSKEKEKLSIKIEVLDGTSHVNESRPKEEVFDISPKVLSDQFANFCSNTDMKTKLDFQKSLDDIAKKCMNAATSQVDNKVMQEIEKLGISHTDEKKTIMNENVVKMDTLRKHEPSLHEVEIDLDRREGKRESAHCISKDKLGRSFDKPPHLDQKRASIEEEIESSSYNKIPINQESETFKEMKKSASNLHHPHLNVSRHQYDKNEPIIDPYDKKSLALANDEFNQAVMDSKLLDEHRIGKPSDKEKSQDQAFMASMYPDQVQPVFDCAPREINWRPYPSFEAREEVIGFYNQQNVNVDSLKLSHTATIHPKISEPESTAEKSYEPRLDHIYTSTSVSTEPREQISHSFVQPEEMINALMDKNLREPKAVGYQPESIEQKLSDSSETLLNLNPYANVSLTELLKRVRMRNRMEYCREFAIHTLNVHAPETLPAEGKCGKKSPPCPPPPPKCPPPSPCPPRPPACPPPPPPPCPKPCKPATKQPCPPPKKNPCNTLKKFNEISIREVLTLLTLTNNQLKIPQEYLLPMLAFNASHTRGPLKGEEEEILNGNFVFRLSILGKILLFHCTEVIDTILSKNRSELSFARDYEPWMPIPSWPISKKEENKRFVCPKEDCKVTPPPKLNGPSKENPCLNLPKRSKFSLTDLFSFSLVETLMCHTAGFAHPIE